MTIHTKADHNTPDTWASLQTLISRRWQIMQATPPWRRFPLTMILLVVIIIIGVYTRTLSFTEHRHLIEHVGFDYADLLNGHFWQLFTGTWFQSEAGIEASMILMVASATMLMEFLIGSIPALIVMTAGDWIATLMTAITMRILSGLGSDQATVLLTHADAGSSALAHTGWAIAALLLPGTLAPIAYSLLVAVTISQFWYQGLAAATVHLFSVLVGGIIALQFVRPCMPEPGQ